MASEAKRVRERERVVAQSWFMRRYWCCYRHDELPVPSGQCVYNRVCECSHASLRTLPLPLSLLLDCQLARVSACLPVCFYLVFPRISTPRQKRQRPSIEMPIYTRGCNRRRRESDGLYISIWMLWDTTRKFHALSIAMSLISICVDACNYFWCFVFLNE